MFKIFGMLWRLAKMISRCWSPQHDAQDLATMWWWWQWKRCCWWDTTKGLVGGEGLVGGSTRPLLWKKFNQCYFFLHMKECGYFLLYHFSIFSYWLFPKISIHVTRTEEAEKLETELKKESEVWTYICLIIQKQMKNKLYISKCS